MALIHITEVLTKRGNLDKHMLTSRVSYEHEDGPLQAKETEPRTDPSLTVLRRKS